MNTPLKSKRGFTLIELLTVIAIIAILTGILVPTVADFRTMAKKTHDVNNLRAIASESQIYASSKGERFPNPATPDIMHVAYELSVHAGLDDPRVWVSKNETVDLPGGAIAKPDSNGDIAINTDFKPNHFSYDYVIGLETWMPSTTPLAFSRKNSETIPTWSSDLEDLYGSNGGHIAFIAGNVSWYDDLTNKLIKPDGTATGSILDTITFTSPAGVTTDIVHSDPPDTEYQTPTPTDQNG